MLTQRINQAFARLNIPSAAAAAGLSAIGLGLGFALRDQPAGTMLFLLSMIAGGSTAIPDAIDSLRHRRLDVHVLMLVAAIGAASIGRPGEGAMLLFLFSLSGALEAYAMGRTRDAIQRLVDMRPTQARRLDGQLVPVESLVPGDFFVVHPSEAFPLDGVVADGNSSADQSIMTGEAEPVSMSAGDRVVSGTLNIDGILTVRATSSSANSSLERVIKLVSAAQEEKSLATSERLADRVGRYYAPLVLFGSLAWYLVSVDLIHYGIGESAYKALTLLVAASPCALILSTPAAILSALACAGRRGLLIRSGSVLEALARIDTIAFDKTGTLTTGEPHVATVWASNGEADRMLALAASVEAPVPHPFARCLVETAKRRGLSIPATSAHQAFAGKGVLGCVNDETIRVGRPDWVFSGNIDEAVAVRIGAIREAGQSVVAVCSDTVSGVIGLADTLRSESRQSIQALRDEQGIGHVVLLTGDHRHAGDALRAPLGLTDVYADLSPEDKVARIGELASSCRGVAMVGDGVNDAPALARATVGITLGGIASDVALDNADVVVMEDRLMAVPEAIGLARRARSVSMQNVAISLAGVSLLTLSVMAFPVPLPMAVVLHEGTTVVVVLNGLRLLSHVQSRAGARLVEATVPA